MEKVSAIRNFLSEGDSLAVRFVKLTKIIIYVLVILMWAVIGFIIWIPMLVRMIVIFSGSVIAEAISSDKNYTAMLEKKLVYAIHFYPATFNRIEDSIFGDPDQITERPDMEGDIRLILFEVAWSAAVWFILYLVVF